MFSGIMFTSAQEKHTLALDFTGMKSNKGNLYVAIYNKEEHFLKKPIKGTIVKIQNKKASVTLKDIPTGVYAVSAFVSIFFVKKYIKETRGRTLETM